MIINFRLPNIVDRFWAEFAKLTKLNIEVGLFNLEDIRYLLNVYFGNIHELHLRTYLRERFKEYVPKEKHDYDNNIWTKFEQLGWAFLQEMEAEAKSIYPTFSPKDFHYKLDYDLQIVRIISNRPIEGVDACATEDNSTAS